jgi:hypothetical protein
MGAWAAWRPVETFPGSAVFLALAALVLLPWGLRWTDRGKARAGALIAGVALLYGACRASSGWDPATGITELALVVAIATTAWFASRAPISDTALRWFGLGLALLALWAVWQVTVSFELGRGAVADLPQHMQTNAVERLESGRAFASFVLPSHLAVVLASVLPLLIDGVRRSWAGLASLVGCVLCVTGIILTYSPVGIGLAVVACLAVIVRRRTWPAIALPVVLGIGIATAFLMRPDLAAMEPLRLRADNWQTAVWIWSTSPAAGVGLGGFGQASQVVPLEVGNRPAHAHCLPLEFLAELGLVGLAAMIVAGFFLIRLVCRLWPVQPALAVAILVVPLHNLVDFSLYTSGVALPWALLVGWGLAAVRPPEPCSVDPKLRLVTAILAAVTVGLSMLHTTSVMMERSAATESDARQRTGILARAHRLAPWRVEPMVQAGLAALESGDIELTAEASGILDEGRWLRPGSASIAALASRLQLALGRPPTAIGEAWIAAEAQPFVPDHRDYLGLLVDRLTRMEDDRQN